MRYDFVVTLRRDQARRTDLAGFCLLLFAFIAFVFSQLHNGIFEWSLGIAAGLMAAGILINYFRGKRATDLRFRYWLLAAALGWLAMPYAPWLCIPYLLFALWETQAKYPLEIGFSPEFVVVNSLFKRRIPWSELQGVVLKDGLLTIDFRNNRLLQKEVLDDDEPDADEDEFNTWCREKLVPLPR